MTSTSEKVPATPVAPAVRGRPVGSGKAAERRRACVAMRAEGKTQTEIATALGITAPAVSYHLRKARGD